MRTPYFMVFTCIALAYSFPVDLSEQEISDSIKALLKYGMIEPDSSDMITGYKESDHGKQVFNNIYNEFVGNLIV